MKIPPNVVLAKWGELQIKLEHLYSEVIRLVFDRDGTNLFQPVHQRFVKGLDR